MTASFPTSRACRALSDAHQALRLFVAMGDQAAAAVTRQQIERIHATDKMAQFCPIAE
jgi:hypothetical protein